MKPLLSAPVTIDVWGLYMEVNPFPAVKICSNGKTGTEICTDSQWTAVSSTLNLETILCTVKLSHCLSLVVLLEGSQFWSNKDIKECKVKSHSSECSVWGRRVRFNMQNNSTTGNGSQWRSPINSKDSVVQICEIPDP